MELTARILGRVALIVLAPVSMAAGGIPVPEADEQTLHLWTFDEGEGEATRDAVTGAEAELAAGCRWSRGRFGGALRFSGHGGGMRLPGEGMRAFGPGAGFSVEAWVKVNKPGQTQQIVQCTPYVELEVRQEQGAVSFNLAVPGQGIAVRCTGTTDITDGKWHHVAGVRDGGRKQLLLYIDGLIDARVEDATAAHTVYLCRGLILGGKGSGGGETLGGRLDAVRVSDTARRYEE
jgi:hypothetical protein